MSTIKKLTLLLFILYTVNSIYSQEYKRMVISKTQSQTYYSVPRGMDFSQIQDFDLAGMQQEVSNETTYVTIGWDNKVTIERLFDNPMRHDRDIERLAARAVITEERTLLFNDKNEVIHEMPNAEQASMPPLKDEMIKHYGTYNNMFKEQIDVLSKHFAEMGFKVTQCRSKQTLVAARDTVYMVLDYQNLIYAVRTFSQGKLISEDRMHFHRVDDLIIPLYDVNISYKKMLNNAPLQVTKILSYLHYKIVDENGNTVVRYDTEPVVEPRSALAAGVSEYDPIAEESFGFVIYPNPSPDVLNIDIDDPDFKVVEVDVINLLGNVVYSNKEVNETQFSIQVSDWAEGVYLVRVKKDDEVKTLRFVKAN